MLMEVSTIVLSAGVNSGLRISDFTHKTWETTRVTSGGAARTQIPNPRENGKLFNRDAEIRIPGN